MEPKLSRYLSEILERELPNLKALTEEASATPRGPGKWSPRQELGHLIDSAANNHIRFAGAALNSGFRGPSYAQEDWVRLHGYSDMPWTAIVELWANYNRLLARLIERVPEQQLHTQCFIAENAPVTLAFLIEDYVVHMSHHLDLLLQRDVVTRYPRTV